MNPFELIGRYFWAICLAFCLFNYLVALRRLEQTPTPIGASQNTAKQHLRWFAIAAAFPWLVMGVGQLTGGTPTVWYYFRPQDYNPFVIAWLSSIFLLSVLYAGWVFFAEGARKVREFNLLAAIGARNARKLPEPIIKLLAALGPFFVVAWIYLVASTNAALPR
jgi:hypothetical protein